MRGKVYKVLFLLIFILSETNAQTPVTKLRINPEFARGGSVSQYFDKVDFIPLQTTKKSVFGDIYKLEITKDKFIISDKDTKSILIFNKDGSYSGKIDASKFSHKFLENGEIYAGNMTFDPLNNLIIVASSFNPGQFSWFNLKGEFVKNTPFKASISHALAWTGDNTLLYSMLIFPDKQDSMRYLVESVVDTAAPIKYLPVNTKHFDTKVNLGNLDRPYGLYNSHNGNVLLAVKRYNAIYEFNKTGLTHEYDMIFPKDYVFPENYDSLSEVKRQEYRATHNNIVVVLRSVYQMKNYLFFETLNGGGYFSNNRHFMYNLQNGDLLSLDRIVSDSLSYFLPYYSNFGTIAGTDGEYIYCYVPSVDMFNAKNNSKNPVKYSPDLEKYFSAENRLSNPVIVRLRLKK